MPTPIRSFTAIGAIASVTLIAACASAGSGGSGAGSSSAARRASCQLRSVDSVYLQDGEVYRDCAVDRQASLVTTNVHPDFRVVGPAGACYTAEWEFVVAENGEPEPGSAQLVRASDDQFADAVHAMIGQLRYQPAMRDGSPVRQIVVRRESAQVRTDFAVGTVGMASGGTPSTPPGSGTSGGQQPGSSNPGGTKTSPSVPTGPPVVGPGSAPAMPVIWGRC